MEGRAIARPNPTLIRWSNWSSDDLQWRAEQSLGQTVTQPTPRTSAYLPSMEGRAIARPNQRPRWRSTAQRPSFNGGPSNRSAKRRHLSRAGRMGSQPFNGGPSNRSAKPPPAQGTTASTVNAFNGGPSNRSAKRRARWSRRRGWPSFNGGPSNRSAKLRFDGRVRAVDGPSMEGQAIARPNVTSSAV